MLGAYSLSRVSVVYFITNHTIKVETPDLHAQEPSNSNVCKKDKNIMNTFNEAAKDFSKNCIEINDQPVQNSKILDGFLLSESISITASSQLTSRSPCVKVINEYV